MIDSVPIPSTKEPGEKCGFGESVGFDRGVREVTQKNFLDPGFWILDQF